MRNVIIKDTKINKDELLHLLDEYADFIEKHTGIVPEFYVEQRDFTQVPTVVDSDGDMKPTQAYIQMLCDDVRSRYGNDGTDNVVMLVHEDNFLYKGIWGQNWSFQHGTYSFQLCRWDKDNTANSFGTLNHEIMHSFDAVIKRETGKDINILFDGDWDGQVVHGKGKWEYVRYQENTKALKKIAVPLKEAYNIRKERHLAPYKAVQLRIINLLRSILGNR